MTTAPLSAQPRWRKLGLIAGGGDLPLRIAQSATADGRSVQVIAIAGFAEAETFSDFDCEQIGIAQVGRMIDLFRKADCDAVTFAGIVKRPDFSQLRPDIAGAKLLPKAIAAARRGDDALLRVIVGAFEKAGFSVVSAEQVVSGLAAPAGVIGAISPNAAHRFDIARGFAVARAIGRFDIGQGAIVCDGLVLAVEGQEGTDAMLARTAELPPEIRGDAQARRGVLVKAPKPIQDRRIDLPVIGVSTVNGAARAGLAGIAIEAGQALILDRAAVIAAADDAGMFVIGVAPDDPDYLDHENYPGSDGSGDESAGAGESARDASSVRDDP